MLRLRKSRQPVQEKVSQKPILFVHGAFGGGWDYRPIQKILESKGREVYRVTLTGLGEREHLSRPDIDLDTHIMDVLNMMKFEELSDVILVGHSYSGMVISGVAHRMPEQIGHLVYMDASLPEDGECMLSDWSDEEKDRIFQNAKEKGDGWKIFPWWDDPPRDVPHPLPTWTQPVKLDNPRADSVPGTYIKTIQDKKDRATDKSLLERVKARGYDYHEWDTTHNPQRSALEKYVDLLLAIE